MTGGLGMRVPRSTLVPGQTVKYEEVSKTTLLCGELEPFTRSSDTTFKRAISMQHRVAITIWRLATNVDYRTISHLFDVGVSTVGSIVRLLPCHS